MLPHSTSAIRRILCLLGVTFVTLTAGVAQVTSSSSSSSNYLSFDSEANNTTTSAAVPSTLFSMLTHGKNDWPTVTFSGLRLWSTGTYWYMMNPSPGVYDYTTFDNWIAAAQANGKDLMYTFGEIPAWASTNPTAVCGTGIGIPLGSCYPPNDLKSDGTGTNQHWKDFVTAIVTHAAGQVKYWEIWNEPTVPGYWAGNNAQMLRMAQDAYTIIKAIDPNAMVTTPSPSTGIYGVAAWMGPYLALGGGNYADIMSFHGYSWKSSPGIWPIPEDIVPLVDNLKAQLTAYGQASKPLWCTEGSWGDTSGNGFKDADLHAAFLARHYILQNSEGVVRYYWYAWDNSNDGLWDIANAKITLAGTAYQQVQNWLVGRTPSGKCTQSGTLWTCSYTGSGGYQSRAVWDTSQTCSGGKCGTKSVKAAVQFLHWKDLNGVSHTITGGTVPVGAKPILLENQ